MKLLHPSRDELRERRQRLLESLNMTREELDEAARTGVLSGSDFWTWEDIQAIDFLLGEDPDRE